MISYRPNDPSITPEERQFITENMTYFCEIFCDFTDGEYTESQICALDPKAQVEFYNYAMQHMIPVDAEYEVLDADALPVLYEIIRQGSLRKEMEKIAEFLQVPADKLKQLPVKKQEQLWGIFTFTYDETAAKANKEILACKLKLCAGIQL